MGSLVQRIQEWWSLADRTQRLVTIFGTAFVVGLVAITLTVALKPKMSPVFSGLTSTDQGMVVEELTKAGIPVEFNAQGAVLVPDSQVAEARMKLAVANKLPTGGSKMALGNLPMWVTPKQEAEHIKAAKEGALEQSIETMAGVASAIVHINFGKDSPFGDEAVPPTAAINITEAAGMELGTEEGRSIARLVQNSVTGLQATGVTVVTAAGRMVYDGEALNSTDAISARKLDAENKESKRLELDLQRRYDEVFGRGNVIANVRVELNMDEIQIAKTEHTPSEAPAIVTQSTEEMQGAGQVVGGPAGFEANNPGQPLDSTRTTQQGSSYSNSSTSKQFPTNEAKTTTKKAAGEIISMNVNVVANSTVIDDIAPVEKIAQNYLGAKLGQPGFSASVTSVEFSDAAAKQQEEFAKKAASGARMQQILSLLPIVALLAVGFMVVKALGKAAKRPLGYATAGAAPLGFSPGPAGQVAFAATSSPALSASPSPMASGHVRSKEDQEVYETLQALGVENLDDPTVDIQAIRQKIDIPLEQIRKMAKTKPEAVAMLMKGWLLEDRR